jgi:hypothetical protein
MLPCMLTQYSQVLMHAAPLQRKTIGKSEDAVYPCLVQQVLGDQTNN